MIRNFNRIVWLLLISCCMQIVSAQNIEALEYDLKVYKSGETALDKKDTAKKILIIDSLNPTAISFLVSLYAQQEQQDSIDILFKKLIQSNPNTAEVYLQIANADNASHAQLSSQQRIDNYKKVLQIDSTHIQAHYYLGKIYYTLFNKEYNNKREETLLNVFAQNADYYFSRLIKIDHKFLENLKIPLIQIAHYRRDIKRVKELENIDIQSTYFPLMPFAALPPGWETNYALNVFSNYKIEVLGGIEQAVSSINWYSKHLNALQEPVLSDTLPTQIYRFTYLRTFHSPIVVRLHQDDGKITLFYKMSNGKGGYEPGEIIVDKQKSLTLEEWNNIEAKIEEVHYWELPTQVSEGVSTDGARWILEGKKLGKYHVVDRKYPVEIKEICKSLLNLTDLDLDPKEIY